MFLRSAVTVYLVDLGPPEAKNAMGYRGKLHFSDAVLLL